MYTTYYANLRNLPEDVVPIAISATVPKWYTGLTYRKLIPPYTAFKEFKEGSSASLFYYRYYNEVLKDKSQSAIYNELCNLAGTSNIALVCYERSDEVCHRHLVASWFRDSDIKCEEYNRL